MPTRIVSLDLCSDWMLLRYAPSEQVVALSPLASKHPPGWSKPGWQSHDGSLEQVLSLQPDLVITGEFNAVVLRQRLQSLGLNVVVLPQPRSLADINAYSHQFASLLGVDIDMLNTNVVDEKIQHPGPTLLLLGPNGLATGKGTVEDDMIHRAGWQNYIKQDGYVSLDMEKLLVQPPDAISWSAPADNALANRFASHPALRRVVKPGNWVLQDYGNWQCMGPWSQALIDQLSRLRKQWRAH